MFELPGVTGAAIRETWTGSERVSWSVAPIEDAFRRQLGRLVDGCTVCNHIRPSTRSCGCRLISIRASICPVTGTLSWLPLIRRCSPGRPRFPGFAHFADWRFPLLIGSRWSSPAVLRRHLRQMLLQFKRNKLMRFFIIWCRASATFLQVFWMMIMTVA